MNAAPSMTPAHNLLVDCDILLSLVSNLRKTDSDVKNNAIWRDATDSLLDVRLRLMAARDTTLSEPKTAQKK